MMMKLSEWLPSWKGSVMGHDQTFKDLLSPFFYDFLRLFLPGIADGIDPTAIKSMPTEAFTDIPEGEQRTGDMLVQVTSRAGRPELVLLHTEVQGKEKPNFPYRMWEYNALYALRHKKPVISIELAPFASTGTVELCRYTEMLFGQEYIRLEYWRIPLGALSAENYLTAEPVLGAALAALMHSQSGDRVDLRLASLERIANSGLDPARQYLLVNFVETYLTLDEDEQASYKTRLGQGGHMAVQALEMTWGERLRLEGALAAKREMLLDVLRIRFSEVPEALAATIAQADDAWLTKAHHQSVSASSIEELITHIA
jgi:hypothetical protein